MSGSRDNRLISVMDLMNGLDLLDSSERLSLANGSKDRQEEVARRPMIGSEQHHLSKALLWRSVWMIQDVKYE